MEEQSVGRTRERGVFGGDQRMKHSDFAINFPVNINISYDNFSFRPVHHRSESVVRKSTEQIQCSPSESNVSQENYHNQRQYETQVQPLDLSGSAKKVSDSDKRKKSSETCLKNPVNYQIIKRTCSPATESSLTETKLSYHYTSSCVEKINPAKKLKIQPETVQYESKSSDQFTPLHAKSKFLPMFAKQSGVIDNEPKQRSQNVPSPVIEGNLVDKPEGAPCDSKLFDQVTSLPAEINIPVRTSAIQQLRGSSTEPIKLNPLPVIEGKNFSVQPVRSPSELKLSDPFTSSPVVKRNPAIEPKDSPTEPKILEQFIPLPVEKSISDEHFTIQSVDSPSEPKLPSKIVPLPVVESNPDKKLLVQPEGSASEPKPSIQATTSSILKGNSAENFVVQSKGLSSGPKPFEQLTTPSAVEGNSIGKFVALRSPSETKSCDQFEVSPIAKDNSLEKSPVGLGDLPGVTKPSDQFTLASVVKGNPVEKCAESPDCSPRRHKSSVSEGSPVGNSSTKLHNSPESRDYFDPSLIVEDSPVERSSLKLEHSPGPYSGKPQMPDLSKMQCDGPSSEPVSPDRFTPSPTSDSNTMSESTILDDGESRDSGQSPVLESYSAENFLTQFQEDSKSKLTSESKSAVQLEDEPKESPTKKNSNSVENLLTQSQEDPSPSEPKITPASESNTETAIQHEDESGQSPAEQKSYLVENFLTQFQDDDPVSVPPEPVPPPKKRYERKRQPCEVCGRPFSSKRSLRKHMLSHTDQAFVCATCGRNFPTRTSLFSHHRVHASDEKPFVCDVCGEGFAQRPLLASHAQAHAKERPHVCGVCGKGFSRQGGLARHQLSHTGAEPYSCSLCGKGCRDGGALKAHIRTHTGERPHTCEVCQRSFSEKVNLRRHMLTHAKEMRFVCAICEERFYTKVALKAHRAGHRDEKPLACDLCDARFAHRSGLRIHQATHSGDWRYSCVMCRRGFLYLSGLKVHFRTHSGEGRHSCGFCQKGFPDNDSLAEHLQSHTGDERPFECATCGARFADRSAFRRHANTHVEEKPFACEVCGKRFTYKEALERHARSHEGPFACAICRKEYLYKRSLENHMRWHKEEQDKKDPAQDTSLETVLVEAEPPPLSPGKSPDSILP